MNRTRTLITSLILAFVLLLGSAWAVSAQTDKAEYIPVHTEEELTALFTRVKGYLDENGEKITQSLDETENRIVTTALIRSWAITQYEDASPQQIDDAYEALLNMSLFLGLAVSPEDAFSSGMLFQYAVQLLDQEYFDLLKEAGEDPDNIDFASYLRDISEALVETPEEFTAEEVEGYLWEIYQESYYASGLKTIAHTEALPEPDELFSEESSNTMMPNPIVKYDSAEPLNKWLGIEMPELPEKFGGKVVYYSIISDILAEVEYDFPNGGVVVFRLSPEAGLDISGVYGMEFYEDRSIAGTQAEIYTYGGMMIAIGDVKTMNEKAYSFAVDAEGLDRETFYEIVRSFIESCRNR